MLLEGAHCGNDEVAGLSRITIKKIKNNKVGPTPKNVFVFEL